MPSKKDKKVEEPEVSEEDRYLARRQELLDCLDFLATNKFQDRGQIEVALSQVNQKLLEMGVTVS